MSKTEVYRMCVGVDLHKTQFTVCALDEETGAVELERKFSTDPKGYADFIKCMHDIEEGRGHVIELAVESTGNARFFKNKMESEGFGVIVVNTNKFKVITMSTKKNDANDAATLAFYLLKEMLPESHLCDQTSEEIRRMLKTRSILVQATVKMKNQIHGMMLGYGIETKAAQFQSKKKRQELYQDRGSQLFRVHCLITKSDTRYFRRFAKTNQDNRRTITKDGRRKQECRNTYEYAGHRTNRSDDDSSLYE